MRSFLRLLQMEFEDRRILWTEWGLKIRQYLFGPEVDFWLYLFDISMDLDGWSAVKREFLTVGRRSMNR